MKFNREILKGHLKVMVLAALNDGSCHAYALRKKMLDKSLGVFDVPEGTMYPTLHKLENEGFIESEWEERIQGPKIRKYKLTQKGIKFLQESRREWNYFSKAMNLLFEEN